MAITRSLLVGKRCAASDVLVRIPSRFAHVAHKSSTLSSGPPAGAEALSDELWEDLMVTMRLDQAVLSRDAWRA